MDYLLGADPELRLWDKGHSIIADDVIRDGNFDAQFGIDGSSVAVELRPTPTDSPTAMVQGIRGLLLSGYSKLKMEMRAGTGVAGGHPIGGHIHLGIPDVEGRTLDFFIGLPLAALEPARGRSYRREAGYGRWGDYREQPWGWEYRTPSSWLVSPATTRIALALSWIVGKNFWELSKLIPRTWQAPRWDSESDVFTSQANSILGILSNHPDYKHIARMLEPFGFLTDVIGDWSEGRNLVDTWRLDRSKPRLPPPRREEEAKVELETSPHPNGIIWNGDTGMNQIRDMCGTVPGPGRLWVVGIKEGRGDKLHLSPVLFRDKRLRKFLVKSRVAVQAWKKFPRRNGELVVGLPSQMRTYRPDHLASVVRLLALNVFGRLEEK